MIFLLYCEKNAKTLLQFFLINYFFKVVIKYLIDLYTFTQFINCTIDIYKSPGIERGNRPEIFTQQPPHNNSICSLNVKALKTQLKFFNSVISNIQIKDRNFSVYKTPPTFADFVSQRNFDSPPNNYF